MIHDGIELTCELGDIVQQRDIEAIVNAANAQLLPGGGVAGAIHSAAGRALAEACRRYAPIRPGQAVITEGYRLPNKYVVHCLGPVYGVDQPEDELLADCYRNALRLADSRQISSIAFPALSTGVFGYPIDEAAPVAWAAVWEVLPQLHFVKKIRMVFNAITTLRVYDEALAARGRLP